ncbi:MATE family efflux transporter [Candidatus Dependentiae bacterium]|nr:MAG: MATE family efflux transporter [Candidatus Dependentiae bacterium]
MFAGNKKVYGEKYTTIFRYFFPEFITAFLLYSLPLFLDATFISYLKSTPSYTVLGATNSLLHLIIKIAESFSVGTLVLTGQFNGLGEFKLAGKVLQGAFWLTILVGVIVSGLLYCGAYWIYWWLGVSQELIYLGIPFLRLRAVGVFFTFLLFAIIGFLRGIKNTRVPMYIFIAGSFVFVLFDYIFIFGKAGLPAMGLYGSALAYIIQNIVMAVVAIIYILYTSVNRQYNICLTPSFPGVTYFKELIVLSWPVLIDKAVLAMAYIWLFKMISNMGTCASAAFCAVRDMERLAFLPAVGFVQIITLLISNDFGAQRWNDIKANIYKVLLLSFSMVAILLLLFSLFPTYIIHFFDKNGDFIELAARIFPLLSILVFFDVLQFILAGALRGAADVRTVMMVRLVVCTVYFVPISFLLSNVVKAPDLVKLVLIYASFYFGSMLMSIIYIYRLCSGRWKKSSV